MPFQRLAGIIDGKTLISDELVTCDALGNRLITGIAIFNGQDFTKDSRGDYFADVSIVRISLIMARRLAAPRLP